MSDGIWSSYDLSHFKYNWNCELMTIQRIMQNSPYIKFKKMCHWKFSFDLNEFSIFNNFYTVGQTLWNQFNAPAFFKMNFQ